MCPNGVTFLPTDCCFSELALYTNPTLCVGLEQSGPHHHLIDNKILIIGIDSSVVEQVEEPGIYLFKY
jgi:hypothetical protein